jgi:hypothetical protein
VGVAVGVPVGVVGVPLGVPVGVAVGVSLLVGVPEAPVGSPVGTRTPLGDAVAVGSVGAEVTTSGGWWCPRSGPALAAELAVDGAPGGACLPEAPASPDPAEPEPAGTSPPA